MSVKANGGSSKPAADADSAATAAAAAQQLTDLCTRFLQSCESDVSRSHSAAAASSAAASAPSSASAAALAELRKAILLKPMPQMNKTATSCSVRGHVWQLLLGVSRLSASSYSSLVALGPCSPSTLYSKIRGDCFRTFQDDVEFWELVKEEQMSRVLNAFVHQQSKTLFAVRGGKAGEKVPSPFTYLQGMNAIAGAFLFCMTEIDAFSAFRSFIVERTPLYWLSSHIGANAGCKLVDQILAVVDPQLASHLSAKTPGAYVYAFHCVSGFCSTIRPLSEVLHLWDFLLAFGPHFNLLCVAAQVVMLRSKLLDSENPKAILDYRVWPRLQAALTISVAMSFLPLLPAELYTNIVQHATNMEIAEKISETHMHENCKNIVLGWQPADDDAEDNAQKR